MPFSSYSFVALFSILKSLCRRLLLFRSGALIGLSRTENFVDTSSQTAEFHPPPSAKDPGLRKKQQQVIAEKLALSVSKCF